MSIGQHFCNCLTYVNQWVRAKHDCVVLNDEEQSQNFPSDVIPTFQTNFIKIIIGGLKNDIVKCYCVKVISADELSLTHGDLFTSMD